MFLLRTDHLNDLDPVCDFMRAAHVVVRDPHDGTVRVSSPGAASPIHEKNEIVAYVSTWNALNPGHRVSLVPD